MTGRNSQRGAALILVIVIVATLAIITSTLVVVVVNEQHQTATARSAKQSVYAAEGALNSGIRLLKVNHVMSTTSEWLTPTELAAAFANAGFPAGAVVTFRVYDDLQTVDYNIKWDQGGPTNPTTPDQMVWVEATVKYQGQTSRMRVLVSQTNKPFSEALPKAVTYSDTGIKLNDSSDIYAVNADGTPDTSGPPYVTSVTAGGTWLPTMSSSWAEVGRFTMNSGANLAAPGSSTQSLGITTNGSVSVGGTVFNSAPTGSITASGHTFDHVVIQPGAAGFLSDYFDQAAQTELATESQEGGTPATAPTAPTAPTPTPTATPDATTLSGWTSTTSTTAVDVSSTDYKVSGNLTLSRGTSTTMRTFKFRKLYVTGNLTLTGPVQVTCTSAMHVGGTITINNTTTGAATVTDNFGQLYVASTSASTVTGLVNIATTSAYVGGAFTITNSTSTSRTDSFGQLYSVGALSVSGPVTLNATSSLYGGGNVTVTGPSSGTVTDTFGLIYTNSTSSTLKFSGNVQVKAREVTSNGDFTISGATTALTDWLGHVYVLGKASSGTGTVDWSGTASVTSRDYTNPTADPQPMWLGMKFSRTGTFHDEYGNIWVPGNSSTSVIFGSTGASSIMCPLLCTTEENQWSGNITYGSRTQPMTFFFMCDNNGIYPQVFVYSGTGTYYGLMVINESTADFSNGVSGTPSVEGAVFAGCPYDPTYTSGLSKSDIVLNDGCSIAYNEAIVGAIATSSLKTTVLVTATVPGSWQQLPTH